MNIPAVDAAMQVFGKPWQTALALLTLDKHMDQDIKTVFFAVEPARPEQDPVDLTLLDGLIPNMITVTLPMWAELAPLDAARLGEADYRQSLRYQHAFEHSKADYLLVLHNDVIFKRNVIRPFLELIGDHIAIGEIGQCWNCPAAREDVVGMLAGKIAPCVREDYAGFKCGVEELARLYECARRKKYPLRHGAEKALAGECRENAWPLPECRVNEWCCLLNMARARQATVPRGLGRPFGAYMEGLDLGVAWFRDMHHQGFTAKHMALDNYLIHAKGHRALFNPKLYRENENRARQIISKSFPVAFAWLKDRNLR